MDQSLFRNRPCRARIDDVMEPPILGESAHVVARGGDAIAREAQELDVAALVVRILNTDGPRVVDGARTQVTQLLGRPLSQVRRLV